LCQVHANLERAEYVLKYATKEHADEAGEDSESEDAMSSVGSLSDNEGDEDDDDEVTGNMEEV
jgi:ubiquitin-conjugating enzyme E2 H